jgi:hypothetical protein
VRAAGANAGGDIRDSMRSQRLRGKGDA